MKLSSRWLVPAAVLVLVAGGLTWFGIQYLRRQPLDVNKVGGTILVYEVDQEKSPPESYKPEELAAALKRRLDPADLTSITVRSAGENRVEIVVPRASDHPAEDVRLVKDLVAREGTLTFVILANRRDDAPAIEAATKQLADPGLREEREQAQRQGQPPPAPQPPAGQEEGFVSQVTPAARYTYHWVELGRPYRMELGLEDQATADPDKPPQAEEENPVRDGTNRRTAADACKQGKTFDLQGHLYFGREVKPAGKEQAGSCEYFVLARAAGKGQEVTGRDLIRVNEQVDHRGRPAVAIRFDAEGAGRFRTLTTTNQPGDPSSGFRRHLAIVLDDQVMSAPSINGPVGADAVIAGNFSKAEVQRLVNILRAGALPARLKPVPVSETVVLPAK
jgi:SecD/SecF fusion protein